MQLAIFDLDETLIAGDSASLWLAFMVQRKLAPADILEQERQLMAAYYQGRMDMDAYMALTLAPIRHWQARDLAPLVDEFIEQEILPLVYPEARARLAWHRSQNHEIVIISATGEHLVKPIARALGVNHAIGIMLEHDDGVYTGRPRGVYSYRQGKLIRLQEWLEQQSLSPTHSYGYSDSPNDLPLLEFVDTPFAINPGEHLARIARERHWCCLDWEL
ncbi:HAD superfamily hydrolase (TIGR01490 family) [Oceanisphaera litoralis]|uniref:HAD family hydrolase n=1 Tax=Oceanisphaera litoralis TaxID=225144 RepID=UPI00195C46EB|nr:HAD family hydrolase [Oceanisphaera litoralis]MBM7454280.1 HAD superfamily hydrolase (TIGR01490 family) [Oceanisphaera litoralis]